MLGDFLACPCRAPLGLGEVVRRRLLVRRQDDALLDGSILHREMRDLAAMAEEVSASTEEMSAQVEEVTASAQDLSETAQELKKMVALFRLPESQTRRSGNGSSPAKKSAIESGTWGNGTGKNGHKTTALVSVSTKHSFH